MRIKKIFGALLAAAMLLSMTACGGSKITAQGLMESVQSMDQGKYQDILLDMKVETKSTGEDGGLFSAGTMSMKCGLERAGAIWHLYDGAMTVGVSGFDMSFDMEGWIDESAGVSYTKMTAFGQDSGWSSSGIDESAGSAGVDTAGMSGIMDGISDIWANTSSEPVLADRGKNDDYVVTYKIPANALNTMMDSMGESVDTGDMDVSMIFAKDGQALKQVRVTGNGADAAVDLSIIFKTINGDKALTIPEDVVASAVPESSGFDLGSDYGEDSSSFGIFDDWPEEDEVYWADSDGQDETIDGMGLKLSRTVSAPDTVRVWHMSDYAELDFSHTGSGWQGNLDVRHYITDEYGGAEGYFSGQRDFCAEFYSDMEPYFSNDTEIVYIRNGNELDMCRLLGDGITISAEIHLDEGISSEDTLLSKLGELLSMAGIQ